MKIAAAFAVLLALGAPLAFSAPPADNRPDAVKKLADVSENLKEPIAIIAQGFPKYEAKKFPKAPADTGYIFRNDLGTVDVGFQEGKIAYMIFKVGVGQPGLNAAKARALHEQYFKKLLHEDWVGQKYRAGFVPAINGVIIARNDVDVNSLTHGM